jgi:outer membrane receptor protein involved in Fe transport
LWYSTLGSYYYESNIYPQTGELAPIAHGNFDTGEWTVNYSDQIYWDSQRVDFTTDLTWFVEDLAGSHEFKGGVEYSDLKSTGAVCRTGTPNGERCVAGGVGFVFGDLAVEGENDGEYMAVPFLMEERHTAGPQEYTGDISTLFVQDAWRPARDLTVKAGLRYDRITYDTNTGSRMVEFSELQPRLGLIWDIAGDAKNILRGSWGRFLHPNLMTLPGHVLDVTEPVYLWSSCTTMMGASSAEECAAFAAGMGWDWRTDNANWDPRGWVLPPWNRFGFAEPNQWDPNLRTTYADQLVLAFERELGRLSALELTYIDKKTRDIVESTCSGNWPSPTVDADCGYFILANIPELKRDYRGIILRFETRRLRWLTLNASYNYAEDKGSISYTQGHTNAVDVYPWHYENIYGYMSPKHQLKLNGFFSIKGDWTIAFDGGWTSGEPWAVTENSGDNPEIPYGWHFIEPRGSRWDPDFHYLDLQLAKGFQIGRVRLVGIVSAFNALGSDQVTMICDGPWCEDDELGKPEEWEIPRRWELGFRVVF